MPINQGPRQERSHREAAMAGSRNGDAEDDITDDAITSKIKKTRIGYNRHRYKNANQK